MKNKIKIKYDGKYPNLCTGDLEVWINGTYYDFGDFCLHSGGNVSFHDGIEKVEQGEWDVDFPDNFPEEFKDEVLDKINEQIPHGCCGGCV